MLGKAKFKSIEAYNSYRELVEKYACGDDTLRNKIVELMQKNNLYSSGETYGNREPIHKYITKFIEAYFGTFFDRNHYTEKFVKDIEFAHTYIDTMGGSYEVLAIIEDVCVIKYGKYIFVIPNNEEYLDIEYTINVDDLTLGEYKKIALLGDTESPVALMVAGEDKSIKTVKSERLEVKGKISEIEDRINEIERGIAPEFAEIQKQIQALQAEMEGKKRALMAEIAEKKAIMEAKMAELQKQLTILQDSIYTIQCYLGETIELFQIRTGKQSQIDRPVIVNQKLKYLDEDLAQLFSIYADDVDGGGFKIIEQLLKHNETAFEFFCPYEKCISFFKISKDGKNYGVGEEKNMLEAFDVLHGGKVGFLVRDGENLFVGYTEEERIYVSQDVFIKPGVVEVSAVEEDNEYDFYPKKKNKPVKGQTSYEEMASRMFIFSILQGLLERKEVIQLPEKVNVFSSFVNSKYIVWNYADGWLKDNRFGNLANLSKKLNKFNAVGDEILVILNLAETSWKSYESSRGRADAYVNRTHDCKVTEGLNKINMIDDDKNVYVSAMKSNSWKGATANFLIEPQEFLNLTYMNSEWLKYFLINKEIGDFKCNYSYMAKFLKIALEFVQKREMEEWLSITDYYPNLDKVADWVVLLSHWKLVNKVRKITDFQAKRFAKYLEKGEAKSVTNLFNGEYISRPNKELMDILFTEVEDVIHVPFVDTYNIRNKHTQEEISKQLLENRSLIHKAYEIVKQEATNHSITYEMIKVCFADKYKESYVSQFKELIDTDLSYKPYDQELVKQWPSDKNHRSFEGKEVFYEVAWTNKLIEIYRSIYDVIELYNAKRYEEAVTIGKVSFK